MPDDGAGENGSFDLTTDPPEVPDIVALVDPLHVLIDDRTGVEVGGDVVGGRADQFDAALIGLRVRVRAAEGGQETVIKVDDTKAPTLDNGLRDNLHVAGEEDEVNLMRIEQRQLPQLRRRFIAIDCDENEGNPFLLGD